MTIIVDSNLSRKARFSIFFDNISITLTISRNLTLISIDFDIDNEESLKISSTLRKRIE